MKRKYIISICAVFVCLLALAGCGAALEEAAKLESYDVGKDSVSSLTKVCGAREATGYEKQVGTSPSQKYTYKCENVTDDLIAYAEYLSSDGFICTEGGDFQAMPENAQFAKESVEQSKVLLVDLAWDTGKLTVIASTMTGTLTKN